MLVFHYIIIVVFLILTSRLIIICISLLSEDISVLHNSVYNF